MHPAHFTQTQMKERELTSSQAEILQALPQRFPVDRIDRIWIFPPRMVRSVEMGLFVLSLRLGNSREDQRSLLTLRYQIDRSDRAPKRTETLEEEGSAPASRIELVIAGVLRRAGAEDGDPVVLNPGMDSSGWRLALDEVGLSG